MPPLSQGRHINALHSVTTDSRSVPSWAAFSAEARRAADRQAWQTRSGRVASVPASGAQRGEETRDAPLTVPDLSYGVAFKSAGPVGRGTLIAIVTEDLVELGDLLDGRRAPEPMMDGFAFSGAVSERLRKVWTGDPQTNRSARRAIGYF